MPASLPLLGGIIIVALILVLALFFIRLEGAFERTPRRLVRHGYSLAATVTDVREVWEYSALSRKTRADPVYFVIAQAHYPQTGRLLVFGEKLRTKPKVREGEAIVVIIDPAKPANYLFVHTLPPSAYAISYLHEGE